MEKASFIKINPADSVVVCLRPFNKGEQINVDGKDITLAQDTPAGHKVLINDTAKGENIIKYGYPIGHAMDNLKAGEWVNENNLKTNLSGTLTYEYKPVDEKLDIAYATRCGLCPPWAVSTASPSVWRPRWRLRPAWRASTPCMPGTTTMAARS